MGSQAVGGAEPATFGDPVDGVVGGLEQFTRSGHPLVQQPLQRRRGGQGPKAALEREVIGTVLIIASVVLTLHRHTDDNTSPDSHRDPPARPKPVAVADRC